MIGLALEGGGVRGSYQAGVYMAMYECGINIDGVCGTSIGALNGAVIASGKGYILPSLWRSLSMCHVFGFSDSFIDAVNKKEINFNFLKNAATGFIKIIKNKGIELTGLKKVIDEYLDVDALMSSNIEFGICTVRFKDFKPMYLYKSDMSKEKIKEYILASAYLPIFKMEKLIDDNYYLDGGFYERKLGGVMDLDPSRIDENIKMGYYDTIRILKHLDGEKYVFKVRKENYYKYLNRKVNSRFYRRVKNFFKTSTYKETTIKALEYIMEHENINYYKIYNPAKIIKYINKNYDNDLFIYQYLKKLKTFI